MVRKTALYTHADMVSHNPGEGHPECPERLTKALRAIKEAMPVNTHDIEWITPALADAHHVLIGHTASYWDKLVGMSRDQHEGGAPVYVDEDTKISAKSLDAARYGVGAGCQAIDAVHNKTYQNAFIITRPPGHHAKKDTSMGFCLFGNVGIAAKYALTKENINKVAIVDFDVHKGNGTEDIVQDSPDILFFSIHQQALWPYEDHDNKGPHGTINNIEVPENSDPALYHQIFDERIIPALHVWQPDLLIISAGFDAHKDDAPKGDALFNDPPGRQKLQESDFNTMTRKLMSIADTYAQGRVVSFLEGGYNTDVLAKCCVEHVRTLLERA